MNTKPAAELHPDVAPLAFLLGTWRGEGEGAYPTIAPFRYGEEVTFSHVGKPFLAYQQKTWSAEDRRPLHSESGYLRCPGPGRAELVVAHPTGHNETSEGSLEGRTLSLASTTVARTASAKPVEQVTRSLSVSPDGGRLEYKLGMAAVSQPLGPHLHASLTRVTG